MSESIDLENIHLAKIGVILDMDNGLICFLNPDSNNDIVSYPRKNAKTSKLQSYPHHKRSVFISVFRNVRLLVSTLASSMCARIRTSSINSEAEWVVCDVI